MGIIEFILLCVIIGVIVWAVTTYIPMPPQIKQLIIIAACVVLVLIFLSALGVLGADVAIPKIA